MVDQKKAIKDILFTVSVISIMGTVGGLEVGSLSITEGVMYLLISWIPILLFIGDGRVEYQEGEEESCHEDI